MPPDIQSQLKQAAKAARVVRVYREGFEEGWATGYVAAIGPQFFALDLINDSVLFDGYNCMRYVDVSKLEVPAPSAAFIEAALHARNLRRRPFPPIDLTSTAALLRTAGAAFSLVTIHLETQDPDCCYIGTVLRVTGEHVEMGLITPDAEWEDETERYALREITRVDFGGAYEEALLLVAGEPPTE